MGLFDAIDALKAGESLEKPEVWKSRQMLGNALSTLLVFVVVLIPKNWGITAEMVPSIVSGIVAFAGVANMYLTKATTTKNVTFNPTDTTKGSTGADSGQSSATGLDKAATVAVPANGTDSNAGGMQSDRGKMQDRAIKSITGDG